MASPPRWAALISYLAVLSVGTILALVLLRVQRAPLPREEIAALVQAVNATTPWPRMEIVVTALPGVFKDSEEQREFVSAMDRGLGPEGVHVRWSAEPPSDALHAHSCVLEATAAASVQDCMVALESRAVDIPGSSPPLHSRFELLVAPASNDSALLLAADQSAVLYRQRAAPASGAHELAHDVARSLRQAWFRRVDLNASAPLFEVAPNYVFSFFLVGECRRRVAWDFQGVVLRPFLQRFFGRLRRLFDFEVDSQVVQCGSLSGSRGSGAADIDAAALQADFLRHAGEWPGDTLVRGARWLPPLVRFAAFKASRRLRVVDARKESHSSFAVQGWGTVAITDDESCKEAADLGAGNASSGASSTDLLSVCEAQQVTSAWVSSLRSWLTLPPDASLPPAEECAADDGRGRRLSLWAARPTLDGITDWELLMVARSVHSLFVHRAAETLENLVALVDSLPDVVVRKEIGEMAFAAVAATQHAIRAVDDGDFEGALASARRGLALALTVSHDDTVVADMYWSWEFKYAVHLPLALPIAVPILVSLFRQLRRAWAQRASHRKRKSSNEGETVPEDVM